MPSLEVVDVVIDSAVELGAEDAEIVVANVTGPTATAEATATTTTTTSSCTTITPLSKSLSFKGEHNQKQQKPTKKDSQIKNNRNNTVMITPTNTNTTTTPVDPMQPQRKRQSTLSSFFKGATKTVSTSENSTTKDGPTPAATATAAAAVNSSTSLSTTATSTTATSTKTLRTKKNPSRTKKLSSSYAKNDESEKVNEIQSKSRKLELRDIVLGKMKTTTTSPSSTTSYTIAATTPTLTTSRSHRVSLSPETKTSKDAAGQNIDEEDATPTSTPTAAITIENSSSTATTTVVSTDSVPILNCVSQPPTSTIEEMVVQRSDEEDEAKQEAKIPESNDTPSSTIDNTTIVTKKRNRKTTLSSTTTTATSKAIVKKKRKTNPKKSDINKNDTTFPMDDVTTKVPTVPMQLVDNNVMTAGDVEMSTNLDILNTESMDVEKVSSSVVCNTNNTMSTSQKEELEKIDRIREIYTQRLVDQLDRCSSGSCGDDDNSSPTNSNEHHGGLPEEVVLFDIIHTILPTTIPDVSTIFIPSSKSSTGVDVAPIDPFPDFAISTLVHLLEGQTLPFDKIVPIVTDQLNRLYCSNKNKESIDSNGNKISCDDDDNDPTSTTTSSLFNFTCDMVGTKIQLLATRSHIIKGNTTIVKTLDSILESSDNKNNATRILSLFEDDCMFRWEVVTPSIDSYTVYFPNLNCRTNVKKARTARKKISLYCSSVVKMLSALYDIQQLHYQQHIQSSNGASEDAKNEGQREKLWFRFSLEEEKVLKMDREYEAYRIAEVARNEKIEMDRKIKEMQQLKKVEAALAKRKEKELKVQELQQAKAEAMAQQQLQKASKKEGNTNSNTEKQQQPIVTKDVIKQKKCMMSFLAKATPAIKSSTAVINESDRDVPGDDPQNIGMNHAIIGSSSPPKNQSSQEPQQTHSPNDYAQTLRDDRIKIVNKFDADFFRSSITMSSKDTSFDVKNSFENLSDRAKRSRRPRRKIRVPVFVTVDPSNEYEHDNPFAAQQPYAEEIYITIRNRYKFLSFYEDVRPPYYGTWNKKSTCITGKKPFGIDTNYLDYDVDSEGEWEEEDGEIGEEIEDDAIEDEEEKEFEEEDDDDDDDGWLAADDEVDDDEDDEDDDNKADEQSKPKHTNTVGSSSKRVTTSISIISPYQARSLSKDNIESTIGKEKLEGMNSKDAIEFMGNFFAVQLTDSYFCMDAFPPPLIEDTDASDSADKNQVMSPEKMKIFASFVHNCSLGSKDKVIDELLQTHPTVSSTRAQVYRLLDSIAEKKKHPCDGSYFWEVKKDVLDKLGLSNISTIQVENVKQEAMRTIVKFVHFSTLPSKERIVDELRIRHENVTASRAEAMRIIQSIATKEKHPNGGYFWIVKQDIIDELGIDSFLNSPPEIAMVPQQEAKDKLLQNSEPKTVTSKKKRKVAPTPVDPNPNTTGLKTVNDSGASKPEISKNARKKKSKGLHSHIECKSSGSAKLLTSFVVKKKNVDEVTEHISTGNAEHIQRN